MTDRQEGGGALARVVGLPGAILLGLGSIVGTGAFVSIGIAAGVAGPTVLVAIAVGALLAWRWTIAGGLLATFTAAGILVWEGQQLEPPLVAEGVLPPEEGELLIGLAEDIILAIS